MNESILSWNRTFGLVQDIEYSAALREILLRLRRVTDIEMPDLDTGDEREVGNLYAQCLFTHTYTCV